MSVILNQMKCAFTKHTAPANDVDILFDLNHSRVATECKKCHTPLFLERLSTDDDFYYISEYVENQA